MPEQENFTTKEAAIYLRQSERTLIRWRNARIGPAWVKTGGKILYRRADLETWLEQHRVEPVREGA